MKHPYVDESRFKGFVYGICHFMDPIINFFNKFYITTEEGFDMYPLRDVNPDRTGVNGHIEIYTGDHTMPRYVKVPIVRIVYDNSKWDHDTSDYNHTIAVTISDNPILLQNHKFKEGEIATEQFQRFLDFVAYNKDNLLKLWNDGWRNHKEINFMDSNMDNIFDWDLYKLEKE